MGLSRVLVLAAFLSTATSSPIAQQQGSDGEPLSCNPGGPMIPATDTTSIPDPTMTVNPGGPVSWASGSPTATPLPFNPGGPMRPPSRRENTRPHNPGAYGEGADAPMSTELQSLPTPASAGACTYTTSPTVASPCSWNGVMTVYPSTTTATRQVDCHGCAQISIHSEIYYCPNQVINATLQVHAPSTYWSTICSLSTIAAAPTATATETSTPHSLVTRPHRAHTSSSRAPAPTSTPSSGEPAMTSPPRMFTTRMPLPTPFLHPDPDPDPPPPTPMPTPMPIPVPADAVFPRDDMNMADPAFPGADSDAAAVEPRQKNLWGSNGPPCPTTFVLQPPMRAGATFTTYRQMLTQTFCVPCAGCPTLVTSTALIGYGPAGRFKTTVTMPFSYTTVYKCL